MAAAILEQLPGDHLGQLCDGISGFLWSGGQHAIVLQTVSLCLKEVLAESTYK